MTRELQPDDFADMVKGLQRRALESERRPNIDDPSDLLGPGFGPTATLIYDWNDDVTAFNGYFWSPIGAINSPDSTVEWVGMSVVEDEQLYGQQMIWSREPIPRYLERSWADPGGGGTRIYTAWIGDSVWATTGCTPISGCTIALQQWRTSRGGGVSLNVRITLTADITFPSTDGNLTNMDLVQLPSGIIPVSCPGDQVLAAGHFGPLTQWTLANTGVVSLTAGPPGVTAASGSDLSFGGAYLL